MNEPSTKATPRAVVEFIGRSSRRVAISLAGGVLVLGGLAMLVLPGPGILVVALGFAVLGTEYAWAAAALARTKQTVETAGRYAQDRASVVLRRRRPPTDAD